MKVFGLKEAKAAGEFAKTREQKLTVIAVVKMLGMKISLTKQIDKKITKAVNKASKAHAKTEKFEQKAFEEECKRRAAVDQEDELICVHNEWDV